MTDDEASTESPKAIEAWIKSIFQGDREQYESLAALPLIHFQRSSRLPRPRDGWFDFAYAITLDGHLAIMRADFDVEGAWRAIIRRRGNREDFVIPPSARARISTFDGRSERAAIEFSLSYPFPFFDRLDDGSWIVADNFASNAHEPNAVHIDADGKVRDRVRLGDGIEQLQADPEGGFWIGYGDIGVYGDPHGIGSGGVVRFDRNCEVIWRMNQAADRPCVPFVDHSYALNIGPEGRWAYSYGGFLLTRLDAEGGARALRPMVEFADAVAVSGDCVMMTGMANGRGRGHGYDRIVLLGPPKRSTPRRLTPQWTATVHRAINPRGHLWTGRGDTLHCVRGRTWHRLSIAEADALVPPGPWRV